MSESKKINPELVYTIERIQVNTQKVPGYYLRSTATINVEDAGEYHPQDVVEIKEIAQYFIKSDQPELVLHIHGYSNEEKYAKERYRKAWEYANSPNSGLTAGNCAFIGYRWPAEPAFDTKIIGELLQALPNLLLGVLITSLVLSLTAIILTLFPGIASNFLLTSGLVIFLTSTLGIFLREQAQATEFLPIIPNGLILALGISVWFRAIFWLLDDNFSLGLTLSVVIGIFVIGVIAALMILRLSSYPRDRFRASNYGVLDLVKFFQYLQQEILAEKSDYQKRIKISFIAHSLGSEVATQTIRILSDVFDPQALDIEASPNIGNVFSLGRLVLVAPDVPVESILTSRANFLTSSLKRCEEAYVFSNEADLALRVASTAANYFSFPAKTRFRGYKLGNVTVDRKNYKKELLPTDYGVVNCPDDDFNHPENPCSYLEIRASSKERKSLHELMNISPQKQSDFEDNQDEIIANKFTYFDCTDYFDNTVTGQSSRGILSLSKKQPALNLIDYIQLIIVSKVRNDIDGHGGYFQGQFSQELINELAFLGMKGLLLKYNLDHTFETRKAKQFDEMELSDDDRNQLLKQFSEHCQSKYIQVLLASQKKPC